RLRRVVVVAPVVVRVPPAQAGLDPLATESPAGKVSVKPTPVKAATPFGLVSVKVSVVVPFSGIVVGLNALLIVGGAATVMVAVGVLSSPPLLSVTLQVALGCVTQAGARAASGL